MHLCCIATPGKPDHCNTLYYHTGCSISNTPYFVFCALLCLLSWDNHAPLNCLSYMCKKWHTVKPEILAGILFGSVTKKEAKLILDIFDLAVVKWTWSPFRDHDPSIKQNHACVLTNHGNVFYRQLWERTPHLQALLDPDHRRTFPCKREPENRTDAYAVEVMVNSIVVGHVYWGRSP